MHVQLGWQQRHASGLNWSVKGYYQRLRNIGVPLWGTIAEYTMELGLAHGNSVGIDGRLEYAGDRFYGFLGYGLDWVRYETGSMPSSAGSASLFRNTIPRAIAGTSSTPCSATTSGGSI